MYILETPGQLISSGVVATD